MTFTKVGDVDRLGQGRLEVVAKDIARVVELEAAELSTESQLTTMTVRLDVLPVALQLDTVSMLLSADVA